MKLKDNIMRLMIGIWIYLSQPLFKATTVLNPFEFSRTYDIQFLEYCFAKECETEQQRMYLERCWRRSCEIL